jgi:hypothetical protein
MPFIKLQFRPGVNRDQTDYTGEGGWYACDKIRFRSGYPEKIGGWAKDTSSSFLGTCRQMWSWVTTFNDNFLSLGTNLKLYIQNGPGGSFSDITPLRASNPTYTGANTTNSIYTTSGSNIVRMTLAVDPSATVGNYVDISGATAVGGIPASELNTSQLITTAGTPANSFTFTTTTTATSNVAGGGGAGITVSFEIDTGYASATLGYGWGTGAWGRGAWGSSSSSPIYLPQRDWWMDNFDNDLVINIRNGAPYYWERGSTTDPSTALATRAITLGAYAASAAGGYYDSTVVPTQVMQLLVSQQDKHLLAFGSDYGSGSPNSFDPLLIRWASQDSPGEWQPTVTNSAGFLRVSRGSRIIRALSTRQEILVWTDSNLYTLQYLGTTDVFGLQEYADNISVASPRCMVTAANIVYWMGQDKFYAYTGRVETLPCTLRNHVFMNINFAQSDQIICGTNEQWNEIWWFYPTANSQWNDAYVVYNYLDKVWYYGTMERTAWLDTPLRHWPQAADTASSATSGYLYNHEDGISDDGAPFEAYIQSNDFDLEDGEQFMLSRRIIPDIDFAGSTAPTISTDPDPEVTLEIRSRNFPGNAFNTNTDDTAKVTQTSVGAYTGQVFMRIRARQMALKVSSSNAVTQWQLGSPRLDARPDGKR